MMKRYFIEEVKCGVSEGGFACGPVPGSVVVAIKYRDGQESKWLNMVEVDGIPNVSLTDNDIYDDMIREDEDSIEFFEKHSIGDFNGIAIDYDYSTTFESIAEDPKNPAVPLIRYLITLTRCDMDEVEGLIQMATGKYVDEIDIPVSDEEEMFLEDYEDEADEEDAEDEKYAAGSLPENLDKESLYRLRLALETDIKTGSVFHDMDTMAFASEKMTCKAAKERCEDEEDYQSWKKEYLATEYEKVKDQKFLVCTYIFAGIGQYEAIIPADQKTSFIGWINANGSAFLGGEREATEEEVKKYIALKADAGMYEE